MNKTLIILAAVMLLLPLDALAYKENNGKRGAKNDPSSLQNFRVGASPGLSAEAERENNSAKADKFRQAIRSRVQDHRQHQKAENRDFRKSLKDSDLSQDQKVADIKEQRQTQYKENVAFHEQIHKESIDYLSDKLAKCEKLTDEQKQGIINHRETQYQENIAFRDQRYSENVSAMNRILGDPNLSPEERKTQMKEYRAGQKKENQAQRKTQREENRAFRQSLHPEE